MYFLSFYVFQCSYLKGLTTCLRHNTKLLALQPKPKSLILTFTELINFGLGHTNYHFLNCKEKVMGRTDFWIGLTKTSIQ